MSQDQAPPARTSGVHDALALLALLTAFGVMVAATWQRWTNPIIDHGRELNLPARLLAGERLYTDVQHLYGPLAPYLNAALYAVFGTHIDTLHASGAACAVLVLVLSFVLARHLLGPLEATLTAALILVLCVLRDTGNCIQPYSYGALYALVLSLAALTCLARFIHEPRMRLLIAAGAGVGLVLTAKPEMAVPVLAATGVALVLARRPSLRVRLTDLAAFLGPCAVVAAAIWGAVLERVPWRVLLVDNYQFLAHAPAQLMYFNRHILGLTGGPSVPLSWLAASGAALVFLGLPPLLAGLTGRPRFGSSVHELRDAAMVTGGGGLLWACLVLFAHAERDPRPFIAAPLLLLGLCGFSIWRIRHQPRATGARDRVLVTLSVFALFSLGRLFFRVAIASPYTPFALPATILLLVFLVFRVAPDCLLRSEALRLRARRIAMGTVALAVAIIGTTTIRRTRTIQTFEIRTERGGLLTTPQLGQPLRDTLRFVEAHSRPGEPIVVLPQGSLVHFLAARPNPLRQEIVHPGFLEGEHLRDALRRIEDRGVRLVLIDNVLSPEFRDRAFGVDYNRDLLSWIEERFERRAIFRAGSGKDPELGGQEFFFAAYERRTPGAATDTQLPPP